MNKTIIVLVVLALVITLGFFIFSPSEQIDVTENDDTTIVDNNSTSTDTESDNQGDAMETRVIAMKAGGFFFEPNTLDLKLGHPVRIEFENKGTHTFTVDELGVDFPLEGDSPVVEFTPTKAGTFEFYCDISGHREKGQFGTMVVS